MSSNTYIQVSNNRFVSANTHPILGDYITKHKPIQQRYMFVYKIICKPTGEVYFGQHVCQPNVKNPYNDHYKGSGHILQQRKNQYDWHKDFEFYILEFCKTSGDLDKLEQKLILEAIKNNDKCLNIEINYKIRNRYGAPSAPKGRSICNVLPFVSPLNGKYFPAYTQWSSMNEASLDVGFKNYRHMSSSVFNCKRKIVGEWKTILQNKDYVLVTRFAYVDQLENNKDEINQYIENNKDSALANQDICQNYFTSIKLFGNSHAIINVNAFTSPINNVFVPAGTVFQSIVEISAKLGFPSRAQACNAVYSRYHKLQWWTKDKKNKSNPVFVALFATAAQLNLTSNNKDTIIQACGDYWNKHKNKIYATQSQFKRSNKRRQIVVLEDINIEGVIIQKGTVFPSTVIAAKALQFKSHATIRDVIKLRNGCVCNGRILYYDELTDDQKQQLAIH